MEGKCSCGLINFKIRKPKEIALCHCNICKTVNNRKTPTPFAKFNINKFNITKFNIEIKTTSCLAKRGFCKECRDPIYMIYNGSNNIWICTETFNFSTDDIEHYDIYN